MALDYAKRAPIPRGYIHYLSFEPNLTNIFKYLLSTTVRQNSLFCLFLRHKNGRIGEFCRTVLSNRCLNILVTVDLKDIL